MVQMEPRMSVLIGGVTFKNSMHSDAVYDDTWIVSIWTNQRQNDGKENQAMADTKSNNAKVGDEDSSEYFTRRERKKHDAQKCAQATQQYRRTHRAEHFLCLGHAAILFRLVKGERHVHHKIN